MTTLTVNERAQVNAALCLIHDSGSDAAAITKVAKASIAAGHAPLAAYASELGKFAAANPGIGTVMTKLTRLIWSSSPETVATYDRAISEYITTGDNRTMQALAPMIAKDSIALAIHHGEITAAEAATTGLATALGGAPSEVMQNAAAVATASPTDAPAAPDPTAYQVSAVEGPGMVGAKAQLVPAHYSGFVRDAPALPGLSVASAREAARAQAAGRSRVADEGNPAT